MYLTFPENGIFIGSLIKATPAAALKTKFPENGILIGIIVHDLLGHPR